MRSQGISVSANVPGTFGQIRDCQAAQTQPSAGLGIDSWCVSPVFPFMSTRHLVMFYRLTFDGLALDTLS